MEPNSFDFIVTQLKAEVNNLKPDVAAMMRLSSQLSKLDPNFQRFSIDAKTLIHLGRDSIKDHTTALIELVKNSYDADAFNVDVEIFCSEGKNTIRISDNGFGMTRDQLYNNWLRIGFSEKRLSKHSELGRRKTGEKGIGRISTDRLGANLELRTMTVTDGIIGLKVNWDDFDTDGKDVFDIPVEVTNPLEISIPSKQEKPSESGTEIIISNLRQPWTYRNIENLYYDLAALISPFDDVEDFEVNLNNDIAPQFTKKVGSPFYKNAYTELTVVFDGSDKIVYSIKHRGKEEIVETINMQQFYSKTDTTTVNEMKCGPVEIRLLFYLRQSSAILGADFKLEDLREFLDNNNGVKIYRDKVAVKPYGFQKSQIGYDWLGLGDRKSRSPGGVGRISEYHVSPNQIVGAVFIERDSNLELRDSAAREGFVESEGFYDMKELVMASIRLLETERANNFEEENIQKVKESTSGNKEADKIKAQIFAVRSDLEGIRYGLEASKEPVKPQFFLNPIVKAIEQVDDIGENVEFTINELLNWQRVLNGLATIGISSAVFGHETEGSITQFQGSTNTAIKLLKAKPPRVENALSEMEKAFRHSKQVAAWGAYALTRVQKEKRNKKRIPLYETLENVVKELTPAFHAASIDLKINGNHFYWTTYQMDIESILVNLLTNAYTACLTKAEQRKVNVTVRREDFDKKDGFAFSVADSGPGIAKQFERRIFDPLFSTKTTGTNESKSVGTGLGLTIVKSIVDDLRGQIVVSKDPALNGANFKIWIPK